MLQFTYYFLVLANVVGLIGIIYVATILAKRKINRSTLPQSAGTAEPEGVTLNPFEYNALLQDSKTLRLILAMRDQETFDAMNSLSSVRTNVETQHDKVMNIAENNKRNI